MLSYKGSKIAKYLQSGFRVEINDKVIYIDPFKLPLVQPKADYILITHSHFDHLDVESIRAVVTDHTQILTPQDCADEIIAANLIPSVSVVTPNQQIDLEDFQLFTTPAYNINKDFHPKQNNWVGFIIKSAKITIFHLGDTDNIPEFSNLPVQHVDLALVPISGTYVMDPDEAIEAIKLINPDKAIPMHFDAGIIGNKTQAQKLKSDLGETVEVLGPLS